MVPKSLPGSFLFLLPNAAESLRYSQPVWEAGGDVAPCFPDGVVDYVAVFVDRSVFVSASGCIWTTVSQLQFFECCCIPLIKHFVL